MRRLAALILALLFAVPLHAGERIRDFNSDVRIARDGALTVTETIKVTSEGNRIQHGIQRDFPTSYRNRFGQRTRVTFLVLSIERDGNAEPYELSSLSNGQRVRIGRADTLLPDGDHVFVITYRTTRQLHFGKDIDELYWSVTGNGWDFPIEFASARFTLPSPAKFGQRAIYTGAQGSTDHNAEVWDEGPGFIAFRTTAPLGPEEGMTVAASFPKNVVAAPAERTRAWWWLQDWAPLAAGILATLGLLAYQLRAWLIAGRGPRAGTVVPLFAPPDGMSAAACRYVARMGMDNRAFTAAIVDVAVAGHVHIDKQDGGWFASDTTILSSLKSGRPVGQPEQLMLTELFGGTLASIELKQENHAKLQAARELLGDALEAAYLDRTYKKNADWALLGLLGIPVAIFAVALVVALVGDANPGGTFALPLLGLLAVAGCFLGWRSARRQRGAMRAIGWVTVVGCAMVMVAIGFVSFAAAMEAGAWPVLLPVATLPIGLLAFKWMAAPTPEGRRVMDRIAGFKHYLGITEEERLNTLHPPEKTPELFEKYLPYAIALDVENRWADKFAGVLAAATAAGSTSAMGWYSGRGNLWDDPGGFASSVGSSLNSAVSSAATSPSSSSGSGGGGSSGGGGGGGGGGGW